MGGCGLPVRKAFSYGIRHISLWFNEVWPYTSLNHNEICRIRYEKSMKMPHVRESATSILFLFVYMFQKIILNLCNKNVFLYCISHSVWSVSKYRPTKQLKTSSWCIAMTSFMKGRGSGPEKWTDANPARSYLGGGGHSTLFLGRYVRPDAP